ncbi:MAG: molybdate ABC transporter permease subunit [Ramlibacter sp.]
MPLSSADFQAIALALRLALATTFVLLLLATPLAWWLAHARTRWSALVGAAVALPLVLPPTVLGFYLLVVFGPQGWGGRLTQALGLGLLPFTFAGLLVASVLYSLPFAVQPLQHAFAAIGRRPMEAAATLRARPIDAFFSVAVPLARAGFVTAAILSFAHTVGEFGVVLMIGGNIPGQTGVVSTRIYGHVEGLEYAQAHWLAGGMVLFSLAILVVLAAFARRGPRVTP